MKRQRFATMLLSLATIFWSSSSYAQKEFVVLDDPSSVGIEASRLPRISNVLRARIEAGEIAGGVTLVARQGRIMHYEAQGVLNVESQRPMPRNAIFRMASTTKPVTAVAIMILVEEGKIRLTDPISRFLPEFQAPKVAVQRDQKIELVPAHREIQVLDLLTHTSGLLSGGLGQSEFPSESRFPRQGDALADFVSRIAPAPLDFHPGASWSYSPFGGIDVLARIVETASGQTFAQFLKDRLFEPLGMLDTSFDPPADSEPRLADYHIRSGDQLRPADYPFGFEAPYTSGAAGLVSTAEDFFRFGQMLLDQGSFGGVRILSPRGVELLSTNHVGDRFEGSLGRPGGMGFGFAMEVVVDPIPSATFRSAGSYGWDGAFGTQFWVDPREGIVAVFLVQASGVRAIQNDFGTAVMQTIGRLHSPGQPLTAP